MKYPHVRYVVSLLAMMLLLGCGEDPVSTPAPSTQVITTITAPGIGTIEVLHASVTMRTITFEVSLPARQIQRTIVLHRETRGAMEIAYREIREGSQILYSIEDSWYPADNSWSSTLYQSGENWLKMDIWDGDQPWVSYHLSNGTSLDLPGYSVTDEAMPKSKFRSAVHQLRAFLPTSHPLVNQTDMLIMNAVLADDGLREQTSHYLHSLSGLQPTAGCSNRVMLVAGLAAKYGCRFWAVPNPVIAGISATACVAGNGIFWSCVVAELMPPFGDRPGGNLPPAPPGSGRIAQR